MPSAGSDTTQFLEIHLQTADLIILLVSANFLASSRCYQFEMQRALTRSSTGAACLVPLLLCSAAWETSPLAGYQPLPTNRVPVSGWTDHDAAFTHVAQELDKIIQQLTAQKSKPAPTSTQHIPACEPPYTYDDFFTDREPILTAISTFFTSGRPLRTPILVLSGEPGTGKTSIALEYCYRALQTQKYQHIFWFNASSHTTLSGFVRTLARQLSLPQTVCDDEHQLFATIKQWRREQPGWLLVLDQITDMTLIDLIVPPLSNGRVLLTTREQNMRKRATLLPVKSMETDDGALFLLRRLQILPDQAREQEREEKPPGIFSSLS